MGENGTEMLLRRQDFILGPWPRRVMVRVAPR